MATNLYQDNQSTILMCKKGQECLSKQTRTMHVRYFEIKDNNEKDFLRLMHIGTSEMLGDFLPNPFKETSSKNLGN